VLFDPTATLAWLITANSRRTKVIDHLFQLFFDRKLCVDRDTPRDRALECLGAQSFLAALSAPHGLKPPLRMHGGNIAGPICYHVM
jgi:hypothetical protein